MSDDLKENVMDTNIWLRLVFMLVFAVVFAATRVVLTVVIAGQFLWVLFSGSKNDKLLDFAARLATFIYQIYRYLSFNTEKRPFPFDDFPSADPLIDDQEVAAEEVVEAETVAEEAPAEEKKPSRKRTRKKVAPKADENGDTAEAASETGVESEEKK